MTEREKSKAARAEKLRRDVEANATTWRSLYSDAGDRRRAANCPWPEIALRPECLVPQNDSAIHSTFTDDAD